MTETMQKCVARAIYGADRAPWDPEDFDRLDSGIQAAALRVARAAIEAMREPTDAMISARFMAMGQGGKTQWEAMIDAALSEPTTRERGEAE